MAASSSSSSSRNSSSEDLTGLDRFNAPLPSHKPKEKEEARDWEKIGAIVAAVVGVLILALGFACFKGIFPIELLGGKIGAGITMIVGATIAAPAGVVLFFKWQNSKKD